MVLVTALVLAACGGNGAAPTPAPTPSQTAVPSTAAQPSISQPSASAAPTPPLVSVAPAVPVSSASPAPVSPAGALSPTLTITTADEGKTFHVKVGSVIDLTLKADSGMQPWAVQNPDAAVLQAIPNPAAAAAQGVTLRSFKAIAPGTAAIMATDRPQCNPGQACPQFIRAWKVTVVVDPS